MLPLTTTTGLHTFVGIVILHESTCQGYITVACMHDTDAWFVPSYHYNLPDPHQMVFNSRVPENPGRKST